MAFEVPDNVGQAMKEAKLSAEKLDVLVRANPKAWSDAQKEQLAQFFEFSRKIHAALVRLIDANT
jgi:hypothetical protein